MDGGPPHPDQLWNRQQGAPATETPRSASCPFHARVQTSALHEVTGIPTQTSLHLGSKERKEVPKGPGHKRAADCQGPRGPAGRPDGERSSCSLMRACTSVRGLLEGSTPSTSCSLQGPTQTLPGSKTLARPSPRDLGIPEPCQGGMFQYQGGSLSISQQAKLKKKTKETALGEGQRV